MLHLSYKIICIAITIRMQSYKTILFFVSSANISDLLARYCTSYCYILKYKTLIIVNIILITRMLIIGLMKILSFSKMEKEPADDFFIA